MKIDKEKFMTDIFPKIAGLVIFVIGFVFLLFTIFEELKYGFITPSIKNSRHIHVFKDLNWLLYIQLVSLRFSIISVIFWISFSAFISEDEEHSYVNYLLIKLKDIFKYSSFGLISFVVILRFIYPLFKDGLINSQTGMVGQGLIS